MQCDDAHNTNHQVMAQRTAESRTWPRCSVHTESVMCTTIQMTLWAHDSSHVWQDVVICPVASIQSRWLPRGLRDHLGVEGARKVSSVLVLEPNARPHWVLLIVKENAARPEVRDVHAPGCA